MCQKESYRMLRAWSYETEADPLPEPESQERQTAETQLPDLSQVHNIFKLLIRKNENIPNISGKTHTRQ